MIDKLFRLLGCPYAQLWLPGYLWRELRRCPCCRHPWRGGLRHLIFCFVDHYEPHVGRADDATARRRLDAWLERYPQIASRHADANGRPPGHSFFYPYDEMEASELRDLAALCRQGFGELEIHLHHSDDTTETLRAKIQDAVRCWRAVGALGTWPGTERPAFGFIHGNWALDNSRVENGRNYCGVNSEISLLAEQGCYADFTYPALWHMAQPRQANSIFYAEDDPYRPKSHDRGVPVRVGGQPSGHLMIIQGPLCLRRGKRALLPRPEDGDVTGTKPPTPERVGSWVRVNIHVEGRPEWVFVKVHTHGAQDQTLEHLLGGGFDTLFGTLESRYNDGRQWRLHYVNAREMYNILRAAEVGKAGDPGNYRDFVIAPPKAMLGARCSVLGSCGPGSSKEKRRAAVLTEHRAPSTKHWRNGMSRFFDNVYEFLAGRSLLPFYETTLRGRPTFRYRDELEASQWRSPDEIRILQWKKLGALLRHAYETSPYYREAFDRTGLRPDAITTPEAFARLPILDKPTVRRMKDRLRSSAFEEASLIQSATGGSTGEPMSFCYDRDSYRRRIAAAMRGDGWAGWRYCGPEFWIWGAPLLPQSGFQRLKKQLHHACLRRVIVSSFDLSPENIERIVHTYNRQQPWVVIGYANAIFEFARYAKKAGLSLHRPSGVVSSAEKLFDYQRSLIEEVFGAPVYDRYGCREVMLIGAECDRHNGLHVTAEHLYVEVVRDGTPCGPGEMGEILLTDLHNYGMPLIRYKVGDVGSWKEGTCPCGRGLPLLNVVEGRTLDLIRTPSGRVIAGEFFPHLFKDFASIRRFQVVQEEIDALQIRLSLDAPVPSEQQQLLMETLAETLGREMRIQWEIGEEVVIETGAKYRPVISRVPADLTAPAA